MNIKFIIFCLIFLSWYIFSGINGKFYIISGLISSVITLLTLIQMKLVTANRWSIKFSQISYLFWLIKEISISSINLTKIIWQKNPKFENIFDSVSCSSMSNIKKTIYGNSITITPGTICTNIRNDTLEFHSLTQKSVDDLKSGILEKVIRDL